MLDERLSYYAVENHCFAHALPQIHEEIFQLR